MVIPKSFKYEAEPNPPLSDSLKKHLEDFKMDLVKLCNRYQVQLRGDGDYGITIEAILADDGYTKELQDEIWTIGPNGVE